MDKENSMYKENNMNKKNNMDKKNNMFSYLKISFVAVFCIALVACSSTTENNVDFSSSIRAAADINPDFENRPAPVLVRVSQLTSRINFDDASYTALFESNHNALGAEYIALDEYLIHPGTNNEVELQISENAKYIGIAVGYRSIDMVNWRTVVTVPDGQFWRDSGLEIKVDKLSVRVIEL